MHGELRKRPLDWLLALKIISRDHRPEESKRERGREREREQRRTGMRMKFEWKFGKWRSKFFFFLFFLSSFLSTTINVVMLFNSSGERYSYGIVTQPV